MRKTEILDKEKRKRGCRGKAEERPHQIKSFDFEGKGRGGWRHREAGD